MPIHIIVRLIYQTQRIDNYVDTQRIVETECFTGHNIELIFWKTSVFFHIRQKFCNLGCLIICTYQYGYIFFLYTYFFQLLNLLHHHSKDLVVRFFILLFFHNLIFHITLSLVYKLLIGFLVNILYLFADIRVAIRNIRNTAPENRIVELYHIVETSVIGIHRYISWIKFRMILYILNDTVIAISPAVDRLFRITHNQICSSICHRV